MNPVVMLVTDSGFDDATIVRVAREAASELGAERFAVQLRDKRPRPVGELRRLAHAINQHAPVVMNIDGPDLDGRLAIAAELGAAHLGGGVVSISDLRRELGPHAWISVPIHRVDGARLAANEGADAALLSPIFGTPGKVKTLGIESLRWARSSAGSTIRLLALGGVGVEQAQECADAGADGVAVIRALLKAEDVRAVARELAAPFLQQ
jgi:thiamine-phosphate pyrophosphorylase